MKAFKLLLALFLCSVAVVAAPTMKHLNARSGLAGGSVYAIFKDSYGIMWMGTSNGLNAYNGLTLKTYNTGENRGKNSIRGVAQCTNGRLYAITETALYTVDTRRHGTLRQVADGITGTLFTLVADGETLYVGSESGLYVVRDGKVTDHVWLLADQMSNGNRVNDVIVDGKQLWLLGTKELYNYNLQTRKMRAFGLPRQVSVTGSFRVMVKDGSRFYIGCYNDGLLLADTKTHRAQRFVDVGSPVITDMQLAGNRLYVATDGAGVSEVATREGRVVKTYNTQNGLLDNSVYSFYHDNSGINWFGYFRRGLSYEPLTLPVFSYFEENGFTTRGLNVRSFCIDGSNIIIGTRAGVYFYNGHTAQYYSPQQLFGGSIVTSVVKYAGQYYIATFDNGVCRLDPKSGTVSRFGNEALLRTASFGRLAVSPDDKLWMAGTSGVFVYDARTERLSHYDQHNSQLYDGYANSLMFDRLGRCWIGTHKGICVYNPIDGVLRSQGFPKDFKNLVAEPNFLLGRGKDIVSYSVEGLYRMDESLSSYGPVAGNPILDNTLVSIVAYDARLSHYWVGTEQGLFCFDKNFHDYQKFGYAYGLESSEFSTNACFIDTNNQLWIGTMGGLVRVNLALAQKARFAHPDILLTGITIDGHELEEQDEMKMLQERKIALAYYWGSEELAFQPTLLNYADQRDIYFEYRVGAMGEWQTIRSGEKGLCRGLMIGNQKLYVRIAGTQAATCYDIRVYPSVWFMLQLIAIGAFVFMLYIYRRSRIELKKVRITLAEEQEKYKRVKTDKEESERLFERLKKYVEKTKCYLEPDLKMSDLASAMECSTVKMSQLLNIYAEQNYYDFINAYRLEEFKRRLEDPQYANYTLVALSEMCGFRKSSFFSTFKKIEGCTPSDYLKRTGHTK